MSKVAEAMYPQFYEGAPGKKKRDVLKEKGEKSRDYFGSHPATWKTVRYVTEEECREVNEKEEE